MSTCLWESKGWSTYSYYSGLIFYIDLAWLTAFRLHIKILSRPKGMNKGFWQELPNLNCLPPEKLAKKVFYVVQDVFKMYAEYM